MNNTTFALTGALRGGKLVDVYVKDGTIAAYGPAGSFDFPTDITCLAAEGHLLFPSFIDAHVHLREPGFEYKEDIQSGLEAALHGGFGAVMAMGNTCPVNDNAATTAYMLERAAITHPNGPRLFPIGALSVGLEGKELAPMGELKKHGAIAISNDGKGVQNSDLFRHAVEYAATWGMKVIDHCEDENVSAGWQMHEGVQSTDLGLKGQPGLGEAMHVARDILLAEHLGLPIHLAHISSEQSVALIRWAKSRGVQITAETCPHYLVLDESCLSLYNTNFKMSPPLRSCTDVNALCVAVADGTIDILATDHAPHAAHEKEVPFDESPNGIIGLETAIPVSYELVRTGKLSLERFEELWAGAPARIFGIETCAFKVGDRADFLLFAPNEIWQVSRETIHSKSLNSPWLGKKLQGVVKAHWLSGRKLI